MKMKKFEYFPLTKIFNIQRGKRYKRSDHIEGDNYYISSTGFNNGIDNYVGETDNNKAFQNFIGLNNSGTIGRAFYHTKPCVVSDHVTMLTLIDKELNVYIALYLIGVLEQLVANYGFGREMSDERLKKEKIALPVNDDGEVDYEYMKAKIVELSRNIVFEKKTRKAEYQLSLKDREWETFKIGEVFDFNNGTHKSEINAEEDSEEIYYVSTSSKNNGVMEYIKSDKKLSNAIIIGKVGMTVYYHDNEFINSGDVTALTNDNLNVYSGLFVVTILRELSSKFSYGRQAREIRLFDEKIKLPVSSPGNIDWNFISDYIKERAEHIYF